MLNNLLISALLFLSCVPRIPHRDQDAKYTYVYESLDGRLDGHYVSYYKNGHKKAEGNFVHNCRTGIWTVWDSTGTKRIQREYIGPNIFNKTYPKLHKSKLIQLLNPPKTLPQYNKEGYMDYYSVTDNDVVCENSMCLNVFPENNPWLFQDHSLPRAIFQLAQSNTDAVLKNELKSYPAVTKDTSTLRPIYYQLISVLFLDRDRQVFESRIVSISVVAVNTLTNDTVQSLPVWYGGLRSALAKIKLSSADLPEYVHTIDDLLVFSCFTVAYKNTGVFSRNSVTKNSGFYREYSSWKPFESHSSLSPDCPYQLAYTEEEHDWWMYFSK